MLRGTTSRNSGGGGLGGDAKCCIVGINKEYMYRYWKKERGWRNKQSTLRTIHYKSYVPSRSKSKNPYFFLQKYAPTYIVLCK